MVFTSSLFTQKLLNIENIFDFVQKFSGICKVSTSPAAPFVYLCQICVDTCCLQMYVATCQAAHALITHSIKACKTADLMLITDDLITNERFGNKHVFINDALVP